MSKAVNLERMALWIPPLWEKDWDGAIQDAAGVERSLLRIQARAANLLRRIDDQTVTFARLAWLNMWTRAFASLDGVLCALPKDSLYVLRILARASFEQALHAHTIIAPILRTSRPSGDTVGKTTKKEEVDAENECVKRLEAYTAWCIWNDQILYEQIIDPETLRAVWDSSPAKQIAFDSESLKAYEDVYGPLKIEFDERKLKKGRLRQQDEGHQRIYRNKMWLEHPNLRYWNNKIKKCANKRNKSVTFFTLVGESQRGVKKSLKDFDLSFGYPVYSEGSMAIHGSTLDQFLHFGDDSVIPLFMGGTDDVCAKAEEVADYCNKVIVILDILCKRIWPNKSGSNSSGGENVG